MQEIQYQTTVVMLLFFGGWEKILGDREGGGVGRVHFAIDSSK
jgi:hypothetical protein